jgi:WD40 repeat protein
MLVIAAGASATAWRLRDHLDRAVLAENKAQARLYASLRAQAQASRWSGRPGRRFHSLEAIAEASSLVPQLGLGSAAIADLRNQAIASLTLADAKLMGEWEGYPTGSSWLAVDGDLERYARSDEHGNISVRRVSDDQELAQLPGNGLGTEFLRFNADGDLLTAVYWNRRQSSNISVWNWRDRAILFQAPFLSNSTPDFTPDGGVLAVGHESGEIVLYELASGLETKRIPCAPRPLKLAFDPSGTRIAVSSGSKAVQVFDLAGNRLHEFPHPHTVASLAWHPQGRLLAVGCEDANIYLWNLTNGRQHAMLQGHQATVVGIDFTSNGEIMLSWSWDTTSRLWDPWTGALRLTCPGTLGGLSHDGRRMVSTQGNSMSLWEVDPGREYRSLPNYGTAAGDRLYYHDGSISHDGRWLAMGCEDGVRLWDLARWEQVAALPVGRTVNALFHPADWELFFSGNGLYRMALDSDEGALHVTQPSPIAAPGTFQHLGIDAHGLILAASNNRGVWLLDPVNPSEQPPFLEHPGAIFASVSPDGRWIASSTWHGSGVKVWDASSAQPVQHLLPGMNPIYASFSRGGKWLMTSGTSEFCCWEVDTWRQVWRIPRKGGITNRVAWTTDGRLMAIVSSALVHLLDPASGRVFATLEPPNSDLVNWLGFTPDGTRLVVSSSQSSRIRVWDLQLIRIHLAPMGLDWDLPAYASPSLPETR